MYITTQIKLKLGVIILLLNLVASLLITSAIRIITEQFMKHYNTELTVKCISIEEEKNLLSLRRRYSPVYKYNDKELCNFCYGKKPKINTEYNIRLHDESIDGTTDFLDNYKLNKELRLVNIEYIATIVIAVLTLLIYIR